jgi:hypothetical protein
MFPPVFRTKHTLFLTIMIKITKKLMLIYFFRKQENIIFAVVAKH